MGTNTPDIYVKDLLDEPDAATKAADAMCVAGGKLYMAFTKNDLVLAVDAATGKVLKKITVKAPLDMKAGPDKTVYIVSEGTAVLALNPETDQIRPVISGLINAAAVTADKDGRLYVGLREPDNQVVVYTPEGKQVSTIGHKGGRALLGKWTPEGMAFIKGLAIDAEGKLWVAEADRYPKRFSIWDVKTGSLVKELLGPSTYGALGGAINPKDPDLMVGLGCEWRLDPKTGRDTCLGVITRDGMENARFGEGANGKLYLAVADGWIAGSKAIKFFERVGDADYKLRSAFFFDSKIIPADPSRKGSKETKQPLTTFWADENGDGQRQPAEEKTFDELITFSKWYMNMAPDMTVYCADKQYKVTGFSSCGAPKYDLAKPITLPLAAIPLDAKGKPASMGQGMGSADDKLMLFIGTYNTNESWNRCFDIATGKLLWRYPDNFVGVHGSHNACPPEAGMIRGSYGPCGVAKLPDPVGNIWVIGTNVGEWHILTEKGFYLTRLFQPDPLKFQWPAEATPGVSLDNCPCGMGAEDFGGSVTRTDDGRLFIQSGKTGFWNLEVVGLDTVKAMQGQSIAISAADIKEAQAYHDQFAQAAAGKQQVTIAQATPTFTGDLAKDFKDAQILSYRKGQDAAIRSAAAYDARNLYLAWEVKDPTPWVNHATDAAQLYTGGDTVDFQLATDPKADPKRGEAVMGDLRLSIGNFRGTPTAVLYRKVAAEKHPMTFSSGVVKNYTMDSVITLPDASIRVKPSEKAYVVEAAIPLSSLGVNPAGQTLRGDFGATFGDPAGTRTRLRVYWNNQHTGLVDDAVFELQMEPKNWGELILK